MLVSKSEFCHICASCVCMLTCVCLFVNPLDCSPPGSSVHGIFQARILASFVELLFQPRHRHRDGAARPPPRAGVCLFSRLVAALARG